MKKTIQNYLFQNALMSHAFEFESLLTSHSCRCIHVRPLRDQSEPMNVHFFTKLLSVVEVDDVRQLVTMIWTVRLIWYDESLEWDPAQYGNIKTMFLYENEIWMPRYYQIFSPNNLGDVSKLPVDHFVFPNGWVVYRSVLAYTTSCFLDMTYFPYDLQSCSFNFAVSDSTMDTINLISNGSYLHKSLRNHVEWQMLNTSHTNAVYGRPGEQFSVIEVNINFRRRPTYHVLALVVPASVVSFLSVPSFLVSAESGERLSYSLTVLLSLAVYVSSTSSLMPHSSIKLPLLLLYLLILFLLSSLCVLVTVFFLRVRQGRVYPDQNGDKFIVILGFKYVLTPLPRQKRSADKEKSKKTKYISTVSPLDKHISDSTGDDNITNHEKYDVWAEHVYPNRGTEIKDPLTEFIAQMKSTPSKKSSHTGYSKQEDKTVSVDPDLNELCRFVDKVALYVFLIFYLSVTTVMMALIFFQ
ncbi:neuronal acetylcholine receptor subunit beta-3-like [Aplysia californica]|uniref:Neuronal acetylcholine receptor subunit beta-3-like n=1 Tax=Aplysia californica TaxID=6500 RepID=A0ABM1VQR6_APLCA|nr:neuronal acetylcholine receptor subunit beta-3-like [Aplysia californica]